MRLVDPDLGRALSGGYHRPRVPAAHTPERPWTVPRVRAAVRRLLAAGPMTQAEIADWLGLDAEQRRRLLWPALVGLARLGRAECVAGPPGWETPHVWRARTPAWVGQVRPDPQGRNTVPDGAGIPIRNDRSNGVE